MGNKPFKELEPILRALESLDPENLLPRYFFPYPRLTDREKETSETQKWLKVAESIDSASKILIDYYLSLAAENSIDKSQEWVELAQKAGLDDEIDLIELRIFQLRGNPSNTTNPSSAQRRVLEKRQKNLAVFLSLATQLDEQLKSQLEALPVTEDKPEKDDDDDDNV